MAPDRSAQDILRAVHIALKDRAYQATYLGDLMVELLELYQVTAAERDEEIAATRYTYKAGYEHGLSEVTK